MWLTFTVVQSFEPQVEQEVSRADSLRPAVRGFDFRSKAFPDEKIKRQPVKILGMPHACQHIKLKLRTNKKLPRKDVSRIEEKAWTSWTSIRYTELHA